MTESYIATVNDSIANLKNVCVNNLIQWYPQLSEHRENLIKGSWSDIVGVVYRMIATTEVKSVEGRILQHNVFEDAYHANFAVMAKLEQMDDVNGLLSLGKEDNKEAFEFYNNAFTPASEYAKSLLDVRKYPMRDEYIILSGGKTYSGGLPVFSEDKKKYNNGLPASVRRITPRAMEVSAVSKDSDALKFNDTLCYVNGGMAVIKLVPELPNSAMLYATQNKIKVY